MLDRFFKRLVRTRRGRGARSTLRRLLKELSFHLIPDQRYSYDPLNDRTIVTAGELAPVRIRSRRFHSYRR